MVKRGRAGRAASGVGLTFPLDAHRVTRHEILWLIAFWTFAVGFALAMLAPLVYV